MGAPAELAEDVLRQLRRGEGDESVIRTQASGPAPHDLAGGTQLVQQRPVVAGNPGGQDLRLPHGGRQGQSGQLVEGTQDALDALGPHARRAHAVPVLELSLIHI